MNEYTESHEAAARTLAELKVDLDRDLSKQKKGAKHPEWLQAKKQRLINLYAFLDASDKHVLKLKSDYEHQLKRLKEQLFETEQKLRNTMKHSPQVLAKAEPLLDFTWLGKKPMPRGFELSQRHDPEGLRKLTIKHSKLIDNL